MTVHGELLTGELTVTSQILTASNATFVADVDGVAVVYKPVAGEQPLWDFPDGTLAQREVAAYLVSEAVGWDLVPRTWLREGPYGLGMAQLWQETSGEEAVTLVPADQAPHAGWCRVLDGFDADDRPVSLIHEDSPGLRRMALFDIVVNNADRKGGHVLALAGGRRLGVDHGLTFHTDPKLRTVLWGWIGQDLSDGERTELARLRDALTDDLGRRLSELLHAAEVAATIARCDALLGAGAFPAPGDETPAVPWPVF